MQESQDGQGRLFNVWKGLFVQGGDITEGDGSGGESIYGEAFADEEGGLEERHKNPGLLAMAGTPPMRDKHSEETMHRPNCNTSQVGTNTM